MTMIRDKTILAFLIKQNPLTFHNNASSPFPRSDWNRVMHGLQPPSISSGLGMFYSLVCRPYTPPYFVLYLQVHANLDAPFAVHIAFRFIVFGYVFTRLIKMGWMFSLLCFLCGVNKNVNIRFFKSVPIHPFQKTYFLICGWQMEHNFNFRFLTCLWCKKYLLKFQ